MSPNVKLSVPAVRKALPRQLTEQELATATRLADVLIHGDTEVGAPSTFAEFREFLDVALTARSDAFDVVVEQLNTVADESDLKAWLRRCHDKSPEVFHSLSSVLAGAYLLIPQVRQAIGYPGQRRDPADLEEAVDQLSDGVLDPVIERGYIYTPAPAKDQ